jgi:hypothetical protein
MAHYQSVGDAHQNDSATLATLPFRRALTGSDVIDAEDDERVIAACFEKHSFGEGSHSLCEAAAYENSVRKVVFRTNTHAHLPSLRLRTMVLCVRSGSCSISATATISTRSSSASTRCASLRRRRPRP